MGTMDGFDHILNWKLKAGSHPFPGKDGGTCINEAALVAAGFEYQPVRRAEDMPEGTVTETGARSQRPGKQAWSRGLGRDLPGLHRFGPEAPKRASGNEMTL